MTNRLSHSAATKFQSCAQEYKFHYIDKLRPKTTSSALLLGTAVDKAFEALVQGKESPEAVFEKAWTFQEINKQMQHLPECELLRYSNSDIDLDLVSESDIAKFNSWLEQNDANKREWSSYFSSIQSQKKEFGYEALCPLDLRFYNYVAWHILRTKGLLMCTALREQVLPKISRVLGTQVPIELTNADGDSIIGFADLVCEWRDEGNDVMIMDLKTSSITYEDDAVLMSPQLSLYVHALYEKFQTRKAGFIVLSKKVIKNKVKVCSACKHNGTKSRARTCDNEIEGKRCGAEWSETFSPSIYVQFVTDIVPEQTENIVLENMDFINQSIKNGVFHRNLSNCVRPWGKCSYFNLCYKNDNNDLINLE